MPMTRRKEMQRWREGNEENENKEKEEKEERYQKEEKDIPRSLDNSINKKKAFIYVF